MMRDMPPQSRDPSLHGHSMHDELVEDDVEQALIPDPGLLSQWVVSPSGRHYLVLLGEPSNISPQRSEV